MEIRVLGSLRLASGDAEVAPTARKPEALDAVRLANDTGVPLWSFSKGKNLGYGGPEPRSRAEQQADP